MTKKYNIFRFYFKKNRKLIKEDVTIVEAQKHCKDPQTMKAGKWFDGYQEIKK